MKLVKLMDAARLGYAEDERDKKNPIADLGDFYNRRTGKPDPEGTGDTLAQFVVRELAETFDKAATNEVQVEEALRVLSSAIRQLESVRAEIEKLAP